jgi:PAS domain S-box-containing protein
MDAQEHFPWCLEQLLAGNVIRFSSLDELPAEAARDREVSRHFGIKAALTIPLSAGGGPLVGAVSFNDTKKERPWPEALVKRLELVAQVFASAIARKQSDQALRESQERLSLATAAAGVGVWAWDVSCNEVWATDDWRTMFGFAPDAVISYEAVIERIHAEDREAVDRDVNHAIQGQTDYVGEFRVVLPDGAQRWIAARGRMHSGTARTPARMLGASVDITQRKRTEIALEERLRFERLLADLSATFVNLPSDRINEKIGDSLKMLVKVLGHDRSTVAEFSTDKNVGTVLHSFTVPEFAPFTLEKVPGDLLPWYFRQLREGNAVLFKCLEDLPPEAEKEKQFCIAHGIKSHIAIPLKAGGSVLGVINFSSFRHVGYWDRDLASRVQMIEQPERQSRRIEREVERLNSHYDNKSKRKSGRKTTAGVGPGPTGRSTIKRPAGGNGPYSTTQLWLPASKTDQ